MATAKELKESENAQTDIREQAQACMAPRTFAGGVVGGAWGLPFGIGVHVPVQERDQRHDAGALVVPEDREGWPSMSDRT